MSTRACCARIIRAHWRKALTMLFAGFWLAVAATLLLAWFFGQYQIIGWIMQFPIAGGEWLYEFYHQHVITIKVTSAVVVVTAAVVAYRYYRYIQPEQEVRQRQMQNDIWRLEFLVQDPRSRYDWTDDPNAPREHNPDTATTV